MNKSLTEAKLSAENARKTQSQFLANMSHEIRTPMNGVLGIAAMLEESDLDETQQHYLRTLQISGKTMITVINDILDYSKVEAGELSIEARPFNLAELVEELIASYRITSSPDVQFVASIEPSTPLKLIGDTVRLQQVMSNLLNNAFKFTRQGLITLQIRAEEVDDSTSNIHCTIADTGLGIDPEIQDYLFQPFSQADQSTTRKYGGTGLGLAICKQLINNMGGNIDVRSQPGSGSQFHFNIPLKRKPTADPAPEEKLLFAGKRLLLLDPQPLYHNIIGQQARALGLVSTCVADVASLLESLRQGPLPDLIMLDLDTHDDNPDLTGQLNQLLGKASPLRVLLTTSFLRPNAQALRKINVNSTHLKPSSAQQLRELLVDIYKHPRSPSAMRAGQQEQESIENYQHLKVMLADDNPVNRLVADGLLRKLGIHAVQAVDGNVATQLICEQGNIFDLILMDCEMPERDGYEATRIIRQWEKEHNRPPTKIYALTAHALPEHVEQCLKAGMNGHLAKPINLKQLHQLIKAVDR